MIEVVQVTDNDEKRWAEYVNSVPKAHFYYDYRWKKVLEDSFGHRSFYFMALEDKKIVGVFPLVFVKSKIIAPSLISIPFLNYGGILACNEDTTSLLLNKSIEILAEVGGAYVEIRNIDKLSLPLMTREHKVTMWLELSGDANLEWNKLDAKVRNQIRKARKSGLSAKEGKEELLDKFYTVFSRNMRDLGTPVLGKAFFKNILKYFPEDSHIFTIEYRNIPIAGAFTLFHGDTMEIPWASSIGIFNKYCPNEFMYWEAIKYAVLKRARRFDLGRCTKGSGTYGFKKQWNPEVKQLYWQYWANNESLLPVENPHKSNFSSLIAIWKKLPLFIANKLGPYVAKEITIF